MALAFAPAAWADVYDEGMTAFDARDYARAATLWSKAADQGSAEANLQLGLMADLGLGMPRDPRRAFALYLKGARQGLPDAAFNVGVMLDAGTGTPRDARAAGVWYARAALSGHDRAAFNLGLLYRDGIGVPVNAGLAAHWLGQAAPTLPAAEAALRLLGRDDRRDMSAPLPLAATVRYEAGEAVADLVWAAAPGPEGSDFAVQVIVDGPDATLLSTRRTTASALRLSVPSGDFSWRIAQVDPGTERYVASAWQRHGSDTRTPNPTGVVTFSADRGTAALAAALAGTLRNGGLRVRVVTNADGGGQSTIRYRYANDAGLAREVAGFLPGFSPTMVVRSDALQTGPGEVEVRLVRQPPDVVTR